MISCIVDLHASASGSAKQTGATWVGATFRWYAGKDRSTPVDTTVVPAWDIQSSWGRNGIYVGESEDSRLRLSASAPFAAAIEYRYRAGTRDTVKTMEVAFTCGPTVGADVPPPTLSAPGIAPVDGDLEPSDTLVVDYSAASEAGLWQTLG